MPTASTIAQNLRYGFYGWIAWKTYGLMIGKILYRMIAKARIIPPILYQKEKNCTFSGFDTALPNALAYCALNQLEYITQWNETRKKNHAYYMQFLNKENLCN